MCNAALIIGAISLVMQQNQNAQQNDYARKQVEATEKAHRADQGRIAEEQRQINEAAAQEKFQRELQGERERGRIRAIQGEAGVEGVTPLTVLNASLLQESMDKQTLESNRSGSIEQTKAVAESIRAKAQARLNEAEAMGVDRTSGTLSVINAGIQGYNQGSSFGKSMKRMGS